MDGLKINLELKDCEIFPLLKSKIELKFIMGTIGKKVRDVFNVFKLNNGLGIKTFYLTTIFFQIVLCHISSKSGQSYATYGS